MYKAVVVPSAGAPFQIVEREIPTNIPDGSVLVKVEACGVCHSDCFTKMGYWSGIQYPRIPGHEVVGRITAVGKNVPSYLQKGTRVGRGWTGNHCFQCDSCRKGDFISCVKTEVTGIQIDGGYAQYMMATSHSLALVPEDMPAAEVAPLLCAGVTVFNSLRNAGILQPGTVVVQGIGGLGHLAIQYARKMGYYVVALSTSDDKKDLAMKLGAHVYINTKTQKVEEEFKKIGAPDCILATSPHGNEVAAMVAMMNPRGKLIILGATQDPLPISSLSLISGGKGVVGWPSGHARDSEDAVKMAHISGIKTMVEVFPLERAEEAYNKMMNNTVRFRAVIAP